MGGVAERVALGVSGYLDGFDREHLAGVIVRVAVAEALLAHGQLPAAVPLAAQTPARRRFPAWRTPVTGVSVFVGRQRRASLRSYRLEPQSCDP